MYEDKTYESLLDEKLSNVDSKYDKREGSVIYDALAPNSAEAAMMYIQLEWMFKQMFGDTADREYLAKIAKDTRGLEPTTATHAVLKGEFNIAVSIGARFSLGTLNYVVTELISDTEHTYKMQCETEGVEGNKHFGTMIPINYISGLTKCELTELLIPAEDAEDTEVFRKRWRNSFNSAAFGGNRADYMEKIKEIAGVGGVKCYRTTNENDDMVGGHVKCVIIASDYSVPTNELVESVQQTIDPTQDMEGFGLAPIGHVAHIQAVTGAKINIASTITFEDGISFADVKTQIESAVDKYFLSLSQAWESSSNLVVRISQIESAILNVSGVLDIADTEIVSEPNNIYHTATGTSIRYTEAVDSKAVITKITGATTATRADTSAEVSPDNVQSFTDASNFVVKSTGKNLLPKNFTAKTSAGITLSVNAEGEIVLNGTATASGSFYLGSDTYATNKPFIYLYNTNTYSFSMNDVPGVAVHLTHNNTTVRSIGNVIATSVSWKPSVVTPVSSCTIIVASGTVLNNVVIKPQLELGSTATTYESYTDDSFSYTGTLGALTEGSSVVNTIEYNADTGVTELVERYVKRTLLSTDIGGLDTTNSAFDIIDISYASLTGILVPSESDIVATSVATAISAPRNNTTLASSINRHWKSTTSIRIAVTKGKYASLEVARMALAGQIIRYELATPIRTTLTIKPVLTTYEGTTNIFTTANPQVSMDVDFIYTKQNITLNKNSIPLRGDISG